MKVKDLYEKEISCLDCPFWKEQYCTQPDDPLCASLDEETDIEEWLDNANKRQLEYQKQEEERERKERKIQSEKEKKRKLRKEREAYCKEELKELSRCRRIYKRQSKELETARRFVSATNATNKQFGLETNFKVNEWFMRDVETAKKNLELAEYRYKEKVKEFKEKGERNERDQI